MFSEKYKYFVENAAEINAQGETFSIETFDWSVPKKEFAPTLPVKSELSFIEETSVERLQKKCKSIEEKYFELMYENLKLKKENAELNEQHSIMKDMISSLKTQMSELKKSIFGWFSLDVRAPGSKAEAELREEIKYRYLNDMFK